MNNSTNKIAQIKGSVNLSNPKREPLSRVWFLSRGYKQADTRYTAGQIVWLHPVTNDVLSQYGQKLALQLVPCEKFKKNTTRYLKLTCGYGSMYFARLKYLTFIGDIPEGFVIDHIDGDTLNNNIDNLRAIPEDINNRDAGFMRKLRNHRIDVKMYPGIILEGYERMAKYKATHTRWQYEKLTRKDLLLLFIGDGFRIAEPGASSRRNGMEKCLDLALRTAGAAGSVAPTRHGFRLEGQNDVDFDEPFKHADPFIERD